MSTPSFAGEFGSWLRTLRRQRDHTQESLADEVGCAVYTLRSIEAGRRRPSREMAERLAVVLGLPEDRRQRFIQFARSGQASEDDVPSADAPVVPPPAPLPELLSTKLYAPPPPPFVVPRARLLTRLAAHPARLTLLVAPPGFGKSTLLVQLIAATGAERSDAAAWLSLDVDDDEPARFLSAVIAALQQQAPGVGTGALNLLRMAPAPQPQAVLAALINDLRGRGLALALVLDDYHTISSPDVHELLTTLVERAPPGLRLLLAARNDPPLPLARWRARGLLAELRAADLRFDQVEASAFLVDGLGLTLSADQVAALEARTEGWAAGLQLAGLSLRGHADPAAFIAAFGGSNRFVLDYLVTETLSALPGHLRSFLLQTAVLRRLCAPLCDAVLGLGHENPNHAYSRLLLDELERRNLFLIPLDDERRWWRYHHLFAEVLHKQLHVGADADDISSLHRRAAQWYKANNEYEEALHHALAAGDDVQTVALLEVLAPELLARGASVTLLRHVLALTEERLIARPVLLAYTVAALVETGASDEAARLVDAATPPAVQGDPTSAAHLLAARAKVALLQERYSDSVSAAREALALLGPREPALRCELFYTLTAACESAENLAGALEAAEAGLALRRRSGMSTLPAVFQVSNLLIAHGRLAAAEAHVTDALALCDTGSGTLLPTAATLVGTQGLIALHGGKLAEAERAAVQAYVLAEANGLVYSQLFALHLTVVVALAQRRVEAATVALAAMGALAEQSGSEAWREIIEARTVEITLLEGRLEATALWADRTCEQLAAVERLTAHHGAVAHVCLVALSANGRHVEALALAQRMGAHQRAVGHQPAVIGFALHEAVALAGVGRHDEAQSTLGAVIRYADALGLLGPFLAPRPNFVLLLHQARPSAPALVGRVLTLLGELNGAVPNDETPSRAQLDTSTPSSLDEPLSQRELEVLRLLTAGRSNQAIADELIIAVGTVKRHLHSIFGKLGVESRGEAIARAHALGLVAPPTG